MTDNYLYQTKDSHICSPVAFYNVLKYYDLLSNYASANVGFRVIYQLILLCKCDKNGTYTKDMLRAANKLGLDYEFIKDPTIDDLIDHDGPFILNFWELWEPEDEMEMHTAFFTDISGGVNVKIGFPYAKLTKKQLEALLDAGSEVFLINGWKE